MTKEKDPASAGSFSLEIIGQSSDCMIYWICQLTTPLKEYESYENCLILINQSLNSQVIKNEHKNGGVNESKSVKEYFK